MFKVLLPGALMFALFLSSGNSAASLHSDVVKTFHRQMVSLVE